MNRRNFIHTAGTSLGSILLAPPLGALCSCATSPRGRGGIGTMPPPDTVTARTDTATFALTPSGRLGWSGRGVTVQLKPTATSLAVQIHAPGEFLESVTLAWKHTLQLATRHLGDAWERAYGDLGWRAPDPKRVMPLYLMEFDGDATHGFGVRTGCRSMCSWRVDTEALILVLDTRSGGRGVRLGTRTLTAAEIVTRQGRPGESPFQATRAFCRLMCDQPRLPREPMVGTLDWYYTYGKCTDTLFISEAELFARLVEGCNVKAFALIDAGWAAGDRSCWHEDQTRCHPDFGSTRKVADRVQALGLVPGIWIRPLCASPDDPEEVRLSRDRIFLDPSLPQNLVRIRDLARLMRTWGFGVIKHDFTTYDIFGRWGFEMGPGLTKEGWTFKDNSLTTAEVILGLYQALRDGCGDGGYLIGCNTVSHLSAGLFAFCRIGDDSGNNLERAMKYGCNPFAFRLPQNNTFYNVDPDCVGNLKDIPWKYNRQFIRLVSESGALLEISTRLGGISDEQRATIRDGFLRIGRRKAATVEPLDWMEKSIPTRWKIGSETVEMDWDLTKP